MLRGSSMDALSELSSPTTAFGAPSLAHSSYDQRNQISSSLLESNGGALKGHLAEQGDEDEDDVINGDSRLDESDGQGLLSTTVPITPASLAGRFLVRWPTIASVAVTLLAPTTFLLL